MGPWAGFAWPAPVALLPRTVATPPALLAVVVLFTMAIGVLCDRLGRRAASALAALAGLILLTGVALPAHGALAALPWLMLAGFAWGGVMGMRRLRPARRTLLLLFALAAALWLAGVPVGPAGIWRLLLTAAWLAVLLLLLETASRWAILAAACALFASLHAVAAMLVWQLLALVPAASCLALPERARGGPPPVAVPPPRRRRNGPPSRARGGRRSGRGSAPPAAEPASADPNLRAVRPEPAGLALALVAASAVADAAPLRPIDAVPLAVPAILWLMRRWRLRWLGPLAEAASAGLALAIVAALAFSAAALSGLR